MKNEGVIDMTNNSDLTEDILVAKTALPSGRHVVDMQVSFADHLIIGLGKIRKLI